MSQHVPNSHDPLNPVTAHNEPNFVKIEDLPIEDAVGRVVVEPAGPCPERTPSEVFAYELRASRERKHWTQQRLADRLHELGEPMDRSVIAKIEKGKRPVTFTEVFTFAVALGVSPAALMAPRGTRVGVRIAPNLTVTGFMAHRWLRGITALGEGRATAVEDQRFFDDARPDFEAVAFDRLPILRDLLNDVWHLVATASEETPPASNTLFQMELDRISRTVSEIALRLAGEWQLDQRRQLDEQPHTEGN